MQSQPEDSEDEAPNVEDPNEGEPDLGVEDDLAVCSEQELPDESGPLPTKRATSGRANSTVSPEELEDKKSLRELKLKLAQMRLEAKEDNSERALADVVSASVASAGYYTKG
ncbi:hypothetical protein NDU88_002327 [Pleurodeles waltl]|uniref:Uncharacterized protein n=1 Tax=Pleurodeles waltl TaxID=8319 RepID=A0AAV7VC70_PLEWA|nr:hypothetical protein NDU88_002327 [Pleurodeles waltl]